MRLHVLALAIFSGPFGVSWSLSNRGCTAHPSVCPHFALTSIMWLLPWCTWGHKGHACVSLQGAILTVLL